MISSAGSSLLASTLTARAARVPVETMSRARRAERLEVVANLQRGSLLRALFEHAAEERDGAGADVLEIARAHPDHETHGHDRKVVALDEQDARCRSRLNSSTFGGTNVTTPIPRLAFA